MIRHLTLIASLVPFIAVSQTVTDAYLAQKLDEAQRHYRRFDHAKTVLVLDALHDRSLTQKNAFAAAISLITKTHYAIENGDFATENPNWATLEAFKPHDAKQGRIVRINLLKLRAKLHEARGDDYPRACLLLDEAIRSAQDLPEAETDLAEVYRLYGKLKVKDSQYIEANAHFLEAMRIFDRVGDTESAERLYGELAHATFLMGEKERAIQYALKGIDALRRHQDYEQLAVQLSNLARMYQLGGDIDNAVRYFSESADYASRSVRKETRFISLVDLAFVHHARKDREPALKNMEAAIALGREISQPKLYRYIRVCAMFAGYTGDEAKMNALYEESFAQATKENDKDALRDWHGSLNFYYAQLKQDKAKAYPYLEKFHAYKDSIINEKSRKDFNELEVRYQAEKKQSAIDRLSAERTIQSLEIEAKNALIRGNLLEAAEKQQEIQLLTKNQTLHELQIKQLKQESRLAEQEILLQEKSIRNEKLTRNTVIASLVATVFAFAFLLNRMTLRKKIEQRNLLLAERKRIASELHDDVGSTLTAINLLSHAAMKNLAGASEQPLGRQIEKIRDNTRDVMENISDIVWSMNPENNGFAQIKVRMREFLGSILETAGIAYSLEVDDALDGVRLSAEKRRDFYLIFKEAVNNLAKHAKADRAAIGIKQAGHCIELTISDNGSGFDEREARQGNGVGNMRKRAERQGGRFAIRATPSGTVVELAFPYA